VPGLRVDVAADQEQGGRAVGLDAEVQPQNVLGRGDAGSALVMAIASTKRRGLSLGSGRVLPSRSSCSGRSGADLSGEDLGRRSGRERFAPMPTRRAATSFPGNPDAFIDDVRATFRKLR